MKTIKQILLLLACIPLMLSCLGDEADYITFPLKADFTVWNHTDPTDTRCGDPPVFYVTMEGNGKMSPLGKITTVMTFCNNTQTGDYYDADVVFVAVNGDELYASIPVGKVIPNDEDNASYYRSKFNDKMIFIGGTGRFEGASGEAMTNAYVHHQNDEWRKDGDEIWHTDFFSKGFLTLVKNGQ